MKQVQIFYTTIFTTRKCYKLSWWFYDTDKLDVVSRRIMELYLATVKMIVSLLRILHLNCRDNDIGTLNLHLEFILE